MALMNIEADAARTVEVLRGGGIAIMPNDVGYAVIAATATGLKKIFDTKRRAPTKLNAMLGNADIHKALHNASTRGHEIVEAITKDFDLPMGALAPAHLDHPMLKALDPDTLARSTSGGTLLMLLNAGPFHAALTRRSWEAQVAFFGSSANISLTGTKFQVEDIEPEIKAIADIVIDYGLVKFHPWRASSTILDIETCKVHRFGVAYENIAYILKRYFKVELPPKPAAA